jgi:hypothetical protein
MGLGDPEQQPSPTLVGHGQEILPVLRGEPPSFVLDDSVWGSAVFGILSEGDKPGSHFRGLHIFSLPDRAKGK